MMMTDGYGGGDIDGDQVLGGVSEEQAAEAAHQQAENAEDGDGEEKEAVEDGDGDGEDNSVDGADAMVDEDGEQQVTHPSVGRSCASKIIWLGVAHDVVLLLLHAPAFRPTST